MATIPFDDRDGKIWYDGKLVEWRDANIHLLSHSLHYGSAVFEGTRMYDGKVFKLKEHVERLIKSAQILGYELPYSCDEIMEATLKEFEANNLTEGYVRHVAWRGADEMGLGARNTKIHLAIAAWDWPSYFTEEEKMKGISLSTADWKRPDPATAPCHAKAAGLYMICTISKHKAMDKGYADALMIDFQGYIAECTAANLFFVMNGELHTPDPYCFLDGITRQTVIELAERRGYKVVVRKIKPEEIVNAQEVFVTGTAAEITPVSKIDDHTFTTGEVTKALMKDYAMEIRK
ncbi:MAG: branched-chain amino acid aminotransferase [Alphaproteobacteria bacterium]|nr:branched-chain amino acid aminotransferase [Alphaproteobacteria bacterium]